MHRKPFMLNRKGLVQCYDMSGGVGVAGRVMADTVSKAKGLPFWTIFVIAALGILVAAYLVHGGQHLMTGIFGGKKKNAVVQSAADKLVKAPKRPLPRITLSDTTAARTDAGGTDSTESKNYETDIIQQRPHDCGGTLSDTT